MKKRNGLITALFALALIAPAFSQSVQVEVGQFHFKKYSVLEGLVQSEVFSIIQDRKGFIWAGTFGGVSKFDGSVFEHYTTSNGLPVNKVNVVFEDSKNRIWFGTMGGGACYLDANRFRYFTEEDGLPNDYVNTITEDAEGNIWIGTDDGVCRYDGKRFEKIMDFSGNPIKAVSCIRQTSKGDILLTSLDQGLLQLDGKRFIQLIGVYDVAYNIFEDSKGVVWISSYKGVTRIENNVSAYWNFEKILGENPIKQISEDSEGNLWFASYGGGVAKYNGESYRIYSTRNGLCSDIVYATMHDRQGNVWFATYGGGICMYAGERFTAYTSRDGLAGEVVIDISQDPDGNLWFSTLGGGLSQLIDGELKNRSEMLPSINASVWKIFWDKEELLWLASNKGMAKYKHGKKLDKPLPGVLYDVMEDSKGNIWVASENGLNKIEKGKVISYNSDDGLLNEQIRCLLEDAEGNIWAGTYGGGIYKKEADRFVQVGNDRSLKKAFISGIVQDKKGSIWFSTIGSGLVEYSPNRSEANAIHIFNSYNGLVSDDVMSLTMVGDKLWMGTNKGVVSVDVKEYHQTKEPNFIHYGAEDGFMGLECIRGAIYVDNAKNVWFGTIDGAVKYNPEQDIPDTAIPVIYIKDIDVFADNWMQYTDGLDPYTRLPKNLSLPADEGHVVINFSAINFLVPEKLTYSYLLDGSGQTEWSSPNGKNQVTFPSLKYGSYVFKVKAKNKDGVWSNEEAAFSFRVNPPFWRSWWFYIIAVILIIAGIFTLIRLRTKNLKEGKKTLEQEVAVRTMELSQEKDQKELLLKEIHHRVKNNLQVINSLISLQSNFIKDPHALDLFSECQNRIRSIALIHEKMYESSDLANINLKEYITALLDNLIAIYQLDKYIKLDMELSVKQFGADTLNPLGLLLNEIISNSLKHAFKDREQGKIIVNLDEIGDNKFKLIIGDNGVGIPDDKLWKNSSSMGMELIKTLVEQLEGTIEKTDRHGTIYRIIFHSLDKN